MKKNIFLQVLIFTFLSLLCSNLTAQNSTDKVKLEIMDALKLWNNSAINGNIEQMMSLFDNSNDIVLVGSDSGEVFKGKVQIRGWLSAIFKHNTFSWEMNTIDISNNGNTAWVFVDGAMIVKNDKGITRKTSYRFSGILVSVKDGWKWRLWNGSVPGGE